VIIPVHDGGETLVRVLRAVLSSRFTDFELIVVDDGSDDGSGERSRAAGATVIRTGGRFGPAAARNLGAAQAHGRYLFFLDADCEPGPETLGAIADAFLKFPDLSAVFGSYDDAPAAPGFVAQYKNLFHHFIHQTSREEASTFWAGCGAVERTTFLACGGFDAVRYPRPAVEDIELGGRIRRCGGKIRLVREIQVKHHKAWTFAGLIRSDVRDRAIPWARLLLSGRSMESDLNLSWRHRASALFVCALPATALLSFGHAAWLGAALLSVSGAFWLNRDLYGFLARKRGPAFAARAIPLHWLYYLYSVAGFGAGAALQWKEGTGREGPPHVPLPSEIAVDGSLVPPRAAMHARAVSRNFALLSLGQIVSRLFGLAVTIHLTRTLLADGFGVIVFAVSVLAYAGLLVDFGCNTLGPIEVARRVTPVGRLVANIVVMRLLLTGLGFAALLAFAAMAPVSALIRTVLVLYGLSLVTNVLDLDWVFLGSGQMEVSAASEILSQAILAAGALLLVHGPGDIARMPWIFLASRVCAVVYLTTEYLRRFGMADVTLDGVLLRRLFRLALPLTGTSFVTMVSHNLDLVLLGLWLGSAAAGLYGAAYRVVWAPTLLVMAYYTALRPVLAAAHAQGLSSLDSQLRRSSRITAGLGVGLVVGGILLAEPIILFLYGEAYRGAIPPFRLLLGTFGLILLSRRYRLILTCFDHQATDFKIMAVAAVTNAALNLLLVPHWGLTGAAAATLASEVLILVLGYAATRLLLQPVPLGRYLVRPAFAAAVMAAALGLLAPLHVLLRILLGGGLYISLLYALRVLSIDETKSLLRSCLPTRELAS
jgi:O-antigen/teichoic acid export membrane protein/glycosyltransferase involved in cell wall biosynthesis